ncbi:MAG: hypothetical protein M3O36_18040 [Myxococcota bacterium]|nr:hypothetical protein [Myxococcota bacterium]
MARPPESLHRDPAGHGSLAPQPRALASAGVVLEGDVHCPLLQSNP